MSNSSYGIETLTISKMQEIVNKANGLETGYWGPIEEKDGKYYLTSLKNEKTIDDVIAAQSNPNYDYKEFYEVSQVISKTTSPDDVIQLLQSPSALLNDSLSVSSSTSLDTDDINQYIKEVESTLGQEVGRVDIKSDGKVDIYDLDGNKIIIETSIKKNSDDTSNKIFDMSDIEKVVSKQETVNITDKVDENNKVIIENYLSQLTGVEDVKLELTESGYCAKIGGKIIVFDKDTTISKAISDVNNEFQTNKSLNDYNKSIASNKIRNRNSRIFIDVNSYELAQSKYNTANEFVNVAQTQYKTSFFTDKLAQAYNSLITKSPVQELSTTSELLKTLNSNIKYSLKAYENIDHDLGVIINSIINEIFSMGKYDSDDTKDFYETSSLAEREAMLDKIINDLSIRLEGLKKEYVNVATLFNGIALGFNYFNDFEIDDLTLEAMKTYSDGYDDKYFRYVISSDKLIKLFDFIEQNDVLTKLNDYTNGKSWIESGLADLYSEHNQSTFGPEFDENKFLKGYMSAQIFTDNTSLRNLQGINCSSPTILEVSEENKIALKEYIKNQIGQFSSDIQNIRGSEVPISLKLSSEDLLELYNTDMKGYQESIAITTGTIENYKQYKELMPYEADMNGDLYLEYLVRDWNKLNLDVDCPELNGKIQYMSQQEMSLYYMYKDTGNEDKAIAYLKAMDDLINRRKGYEMAYERFEKYSQVGGLVSLLSTTDGFGDGVDSFFRGIMNVVFADGKRDATDYRDIYFMSMLAGDANSITGGIDTLEDLSPEMKQLVRYNYSTWKGVGTALIPTAVSLIPCWWGQSASKALWGAYTLGSSREIALQTGASGADALAYGLFSAGTSVALNKILGGIAGLNGQSPPQGMTQFLTSMIKQGGRTVTGSLVDKLYRSAILGQPIDLSSFSSEAFDSAIIGMLTAAIMNGMTKLTIKVADGFIFKYSDKYNSYAEMKADMKTQFKQSDLYQKMIRLKATAGDAWKKLLAKFDNSVVKEWVVDDGWDDDLGVDKEISARYKDVTVFAEKLLPGYKLQPNEALIYDSEKGEIFIIDTDSGREVKIPADFFIKDSGVLHLTNGVITDKDNIRRVPMPDVIKENHLMLVRSTSVLPTGGVITTPQEGGSPGDNSPVAYNGETIYPSTDNRHTIHWTLNGFVNGDFEGAGNWKSNPFIILEPYEYHVNDSCAGGFSGDVSFDQSMTLSKDAVILVDSNWYNEHSGELPSGYNYRVISGDKSLCVANVLSEMGYYSNDVPMDVPTSASSTQQYQFEKEVDRVLAENGARAVGVRPFGGIYDNYNHDMNRNEAILEYSRGQNVDLGQQDVPISNEEFLTIIDEGDKMLDIKTGEVDVSKFKTYHGYDLKEYMTTAMYNHGIRYDANKGFYIPKYDSWYNSHINNTGPDTTEIDAAYSSLINNTINKQQ